MTKSQLQCADICNVGSWYRGATGLTLTQVPISFIHARDARRPLCCSRLQLQHILTYYQAMPLFLEHVFTFCKRDDPHLQAIFHTDDYLGSRGLNVTEATSRIGKRIQHCFNLVGVEYDPDDAMKYKFRQAAAYYSCDPTKGQSVWVVLKANLVIRDRLIKISESQGGERTDPTSSFRADLRSHLVFYEWSVQNWTAYLNYLERKISESAAYRHIPVADLTTDENITELIKQKSFHEKSSQAQENRQTSRSSTWRPSSIPLVGKTWQQPNNAHAQVCNMCLRVNGMGSDELFKFSKLQALYQQATQLQDARAVLSQNGTVMVDMIKHFRSLAETHELSQIDHEQAEIQAFASRTGRCIRQLENYKARLDTLQERLNTHTSLVSCPCCGTSPPWA
jgi:hypothetical protein